MDSKAEMGTGGGAVDKAETWMVLRWQCVAFTSARRFTSARNDVTSVEIRTECILDEEAATRGTPAATHRSPHRPSRAHLERLYWRREPPFPPGASPRAVNTSYYAYGHIMWPHREPCQKENVKRAKPNSNAHLD